MTRTLIYADAVSDGEEKLYLSAGGQSVRVRISGGVTTYQWTHKDHLGSPLAASDASGAILWRESYTPFGEKRLDPAANRDDEGYTGHQEDDATGLVYMQARYYNAAVGRFLATDPIGYADQMNLYAYVHNDPVNAWDPTGMCTGSRITTEGGNCASTGGSTTDTKGSLQGMMTRRGLKKIASALVAAASSAVQSSDDPITEGEVEDNSSFQRDSDEAWEKSDPESDFDERREVGFWVVLSRYSTGGIRYRFRGFIVGTRGVPGLQMGRAPALERDQIALEFHTHPFDVAPDGTVFELGPSPSDIRNKRSALAVVRNKDGLVWY